MMVVLHNIRSAQNVGAIFRTADAVGCEKIYLTGYTPRPLDRFGRPDPRVAKAALSAERTLAWEGRVSALALLKQLRSEKRKVIAIEQHASAQPLWRINLGSKDWERAVLLVGNEVRGISKSILDLTDIILEIPMIGQKESLNVSVAFGVAAFTLLPKTRRRTASKKTRRN